jgi:RNAse (barnase) inhibitor barstar
VAVVRIPTARIVDWDSFHDVFAEALGFPDFYGRNMDAWIDCMRYADEDDGMRNITIASGELLTLELKGAFDFERRCSEQYQALIEGVQAINEDRLERSDEPILAVAEA